MAPLSSPSISGRKETAYTLTTWFSLTAPHRVVHPHCQHNQQPQPRGIQVATVSGASPPMERRVHFGSMLQHAKGAARARRGSLQGQAGQGSSKQGSGPLTLRHSCHVSNSRKCIECTRARGALNQGSRGSSYGCSGGWRAQETSKGSGKDRIAALKPLKPLRFRGAFSS